MYVVVLDVNVRVQRANHTTLVFAQCARGDHDVSTKYGPCGIITAVLLFPIGLICLL
jgi:hypothetical protein